jgi:type II secretory pathway component PulJ
MKKRRGIALFEVLLALAIFALAFVGIGRVLAGLVDAAGRAERSRYVRSQMESRMALLKKGFIQPMREEQKADDRGIIYILDIKKAEIRGEKSVLLNGLYTVKVEARWMQGREEQVDDLETLFYQP